MSRPLFFTAAPFCYRCLLLAWLPLIVTATRPLRTSSISFPSHFVRFHSSLGCYWTIAWVYYWICALKTRQCLRCWTDRMTSLRYCWAHLYWRLVFLHFWCCPSCSDQTRFCSAPCCKDWTMWSLVCLLAWHWTYSVQICWSPQHWPCYVAQVIIFLQ